MCLTVSCSVWARGERCVAGGRAGAPRRPTPRSTPSCPSPRKLSKELCCWNWPTPSCYDGKIFLGIRATDWKWQNLNPKIRGDISFQTSWDKITLYRFLLNQNPSFMVLPKKIKIAMTYFIIIIIIIYFKLQKQVIFVLVTVSLLSMLCHWKIINSQKCFFALFKSYK